MVSFDFLFQANEDFRMEEFVNRDTQSVAKYFDSGNGTYKNLPAFCLIFRLEQNE